MILSGKSVLFNDDKEVITIVLVFTYRQIIIRDTVMDDRRKGQYM